MNAYRYVIVGGGMAAHAAVQGIRELDTQSPVGVFGEESTAPYRRPALSKDLWSNGAFEDALLGDVDANTNLHLGERIKEIDPVRHRIRNTQGEEYTYEKLLLVTGGRVRKLPFDEGHVQYFRSESDYHSLRAHCGKGQRMVIIGGGFIGSEIAAALARNGEQVTMLFPEMGIGGGIFPEELSVWLNDYYRKKNVDVQAGASVEGIEERNGHFVIRTNLAQSYEADHIVAGIGIEPDITLAEQAGIHTSDGIVVDCFLRSNADDVYAAGDVASFPYAAFDRHVRVEHEDNAMTMGKQAGRNMILQYRGEEAEAYVHLPMFYSDLFDLGYEAVGQLDAQLATMIDWKEPYRQGIVYYLDGDRVRGVLLWNVWEKVDAARALIAHPGPFPKEEFADWRLPMD
ncbi:MAG: FAD-dependent oxidoreductase [Bacteroidetes bacterium]|nr:FAD-dependent oxidoreductase [Bacteroidota bacterium]